MAESLRDAGHWADVVDREWRLVYSTDDALRIYGGLTDLAPVALGAHYFGAEAIDVRLGWRSGPNTLEQVRELFGVIGGSILADTAGGRDRLRELIHPALRDMVDRLSPSPRPRRDRSCRMGCTWARRWTSSPRCGSTMRPDGTPGPR